MALFFKRKKKAAEEKEIEKIFTEIQQYYTDINVLTYAMCVVINYIARKFALNEVLFYNGNSPVYKENYYAWNVQPNKFQSAYEFKYDIASQLLLNDEVLIIQEGDSLFVAEPGFTVKQVGINEYIFTDVVKNGQRFIGKMYKSSDVMYISYSGNEIKSKISSMLSGIQELITAASTNYELSSYQKGFIKIQALETGNKNRNEQVDELINNHFKRLFQIKQNAVLPLYEGMDFIDINKDRSSAKRSEVADIKDLIKEAITDVCVGYGVLPSAVIGDKENTKEAERATLTGAIKPLALMLEQVINSIFIEKEKYVKGNYARIELATCIYSTIFDNADASDKLLASTQYSPDELRVARGSRPANEWWSGKHLKTRNYDFISEKMSNEGGEENGTIK